ncbi:MAG: IPT/TIG domain-containing protein [Patescibacteria group bacterium]
MKNIKFTIIAALTLLVSFATVQSASAELIYVPYNTVASTSVWAAPVTKTNTSGSFTTTTLTGCIPGGIYNVTTGALCVTNTTPVQTPIPAVSGCVTFVSDLYFGMQNSEVVRLQTFLIGRGYLGAGLSTGYFGPLTMAAVIKFQGDNAINTTGYVGPITRARIITLTCGQVVIPPVVVPPIITSAPTITSISPNSGPFGTLVTIYGRDFSLTNNSVNFANVNTVSTNIPSYNGTYIQFVIPASACPANNFACALIGLAPGQYPISVSTAYGTSNSLTFTATNPNGQYLPPTVSGIDGPSNLTVGQVGTWSVRAIDQTGGGLSYQVTWGDENQYGTSAANSNSFSQTATFTHAYNQVGTYSPIFVVRGSNGLTAQTSLTVRVTTSGQSTSTAPTISSLSPSSGPVGTIVTVTGNNFVRYDNAINFGGVNRAITGVQSTNGTTLQFNVPATPCAQGNYCAQVVINPGIYGISVSTLYGTSSSLNFNVTSVPATTTINQNITLPLNQIGTVSTLQITALKIVEDSRCPTNVTCIWAGRVVVQTKLKSGVNQATINLVNDEEFVLDGYKVKIIEVTPAKTSSGQIINNGQYRITYRVIK